MGAFWKALAGSFAGKILATVFIAVCLTLGFGPDKWAGFMVRELPQWVTPQVGRIAFITLALMTVAFLFWPLITRTFASIGRRTPDLIPLSEAARSLYESAREKATLMATAAERLSSGDRSPNDILNWMATYIFGKAAILGSRPPSSKRELIEDKHGHFENGALIYKTDRHVYTDLAIERREVQRLLETIVDDGRAPR